MNYVYVGATAGEDVPDDEVLRAVRDRLGAEFDMPVREIALPAVDFAWDEKRRQYGSIPVLGMLVRECPQDAAKLLAVTGRDLFIPVLTFVFGQAQLGGRVAVISLARLRQEFYGLPPDREIFVDPFHRGELLTPEGCRSRVEKILGRPAAFDPAYLQATPKCSTLYRLLNNLKQIYLRREQPERAGRVVEQMLIVQPDSCEDVRDRGMLFLQVNAYARGVAWLTRYLERAPEAPDADRVRRWIERAHERRAQLN